MRITWEVKIQSEGLQTAYLATPDGQKVSVYQQDSQEEIQLPNEEYLRVVLKIVKNNIKNTHLYRVASPSQENNGRFKLIIEEREHSCSGFSGLRIFASLKKEDEVDSPFQGNNGRFKIIIEERGHSCSGSSGLRIIFASLKKEDEEGPQEIICGNGLVRPTGRRFSPVPPLDLPKGKPPASFALYEKRLLLGE